jgi:hypothetical protein
VASAVGLATGVTGEDGIGKGDAEAVAAAGLATGDAVDWAGAE